MTNPKDSAILPDMTDSELELEGHIIELWTNNQGPRLGNVSNIPARRRVAQVSHKNGDAWIAYDADGGRVVIGPRANITDLGPAKAGWMSW